MYRELRKARWNDTVKVLSEVVERSSQLSQVKARELGSFYGEASGAKDRLAASGMTGEQFMSVIDAGLMTQLLHMEGRIASSIGKGFYTIGPCGEEVLAASSLHLKGTDSVALHYRHTANSILRQMTAGRSVDDIMLDRARAYTCSSLDPVTGGRHCSIGGGPNEFLVTSTLASQCPPAVGRALGIPLSSMLNIPNPTFPKGSISYVSVGDGSTSNAHFLAAVNLTKYAAHRKTKVPVVFGVSDNGICISLKGQGYVNQLVESLGITTFVADGRNVYDVYQKSKEATHYARVYSKPCVLLYQNIPRRFGHASTDRQFAYLSPEHIAEQQSLNPLSWAMGEAVEAGLLTFDELEGKLIGMEESILQAFDKASDEPKITSRDKLVASNSAPLAAKPALTTEEVAASAQGSGKKAEQVVMRKHMTAVYKELLERGSDTLYIGEDVEHGGYYLVTDGLKAAFPTRVQDFPPDETTLMGAGQGFAQSGFLPIVELPYAKYLDCGADTFQESIISHWLSNGTQPNGMVYRLQGFDKGVFGGNYHTHNALPFLYSPGLDVICHSNGANYARAMRYAYRQAKAGRVVLSVDCTDLLNKRHLDDKEKDGYFLGEYPANADDEWGFDEIAVHRMGVDGKWGNVRGGEALSATGGGNKKKTGKKGSKGEAIDVAIVTYGNGVPTSLKAAAAMMNAKGTTTSNVVVLESPYLSAPPQELVDYLSSQNIQRVVFADICKASMSPFSSISTKLHSEGVLDGKKWAVTAAADTYNPLGNLVTFLSEEDIQGAAERLQ